MNTADERGRNIIQLYVNEHGGSMEEGARDIMTDIMLFLEYWVGGACVEEARRLSYNNYLEEIKTEGKTDE